MAKKKPAETKPPAQPAAKTEKKDAKAAPPPAPATKAPAGKSVLAKAAGKVAGAVSKAAVAVQEHVLQPVAEAVGIAKKKPEKKPRVRFVREKKEKRAEAKPAPLARSTSVAGKMMSKNVKPVPKDDATRPGNKPVA